MYRSFYKLSARPFLLSPDSRFFFESQSHKRAMAYLRYGLEQGEGFIVITGGIGTGKSTLVETLFGSLKREDYFVARVVTTQLDADDLLRMVCASFGLPHEHVSKAGLLKGIEAFFHKRAMNRERVLLVIDEAQNMPKKSLEELRMLSNIQPGGVSVLQTFLLGQNEFMDTLQAGDMEQLRQRIIASYQLKPMSQPETREYIEHRMRLVGWGGDPSFTEDAYENIYLQTEGVPRRINMLCDRVLLYGCLENLHNLSGESVQAVAQELYGELGHAGVEGNAANGSAGRKSGWQPDALADDGNPSRRTDSADSLDNAAGFAADTDLRRSGFGERAPGNHGATLRYPGEQGEDVHSDQAGTRHAASSVPLNALFIADRIDTAGGGGGKNVSHDYPVGTREISQLAGDRRQFDSPGGQDSSPGLDLAAESDEGKSRRSPVYFRNMFYLVLFIIVVNVIVFRELIPLGSISSVSQPDTTRDEAVSDAADVVNRESQPSIPSAKGEAAGVPDVRSDQSRVIADGDGGPAKGAANPEQGLALNSHREGMRADGRSASIIGSASPPVSKPQIASASQMDRERSLSNKAAEEANTRSPAAVQPRSGGNKSGLAITSVQEAAAGSKTTAQEKVRAESPSPAKKLEVMRQTLGAEPTISPVFPGQSQLIGHPLKMDAEQSADATTAQAGAAPILTKKEPAGNLPAEPARPSLGEPLAGFGETSAQLSKSTQPRVNEQSAGGAEAVASLAPAPELPEIRSATIQEMDDLVATFYRAYEAGDIDLLLSLFSDNARTNDQSDKTGIARDYRELFEVSERRTFHIERLRWEQDKNGDLRGEGDFQVNVQLKSDHSVTSVGGKIILYIKKSPQGTQITQLMHTYN